MVNQEFSCIKEVTKIVNLTLPSMYNSNEISGICDTLESWKRQYIKQLQGIVVGYKNVSLTSKRGYLKAECPCIYCNVKATFELFYPTIGSIIMGKINRISHDYIGCIVHDTINVTVYRTVETSSDISKFIVLDNLILFQITRINFKSKFIHVKGKITEECVTLMRDSDIFSDNIVASDNNMLSSSSLSFPTNNSSIFYDDPITSVNTDQEIFDVDSSIENSSQTSLPKKKKKHKKSKDNSKLPASVKNESFENDINHVESTKISENTKKRKRKRSHVNLSSSTNELENETELIHPKKKIKTEKTVLMNDTTDMLNSTSFTHTNNSDSEKIASKSGKSTKKSNLSTDVKKKKHKKSKNSLENILSHSDQIIKAETNDLKSTLSPNKNFSQNCEEDFLTSPDLFDDSSNQIKVENEPVVKPKKKKKKSSSDKKDRKKKKDKLKKGSKKDKKNKKKVISTKKKLHGQSSKSKKKNVDKKKSKKPKKIKKDKKIK